MRFLRVTAATALALLFTGAQAGAGALINACILYNDTSRPDFDVFWDHGADSDHCLNAWGTALPKMMKVNATKGYTTCAHMGYVEQKSSSTDGDFCLSEKSHWTLGYDVHSDFITQDNVKWKVSDDVQFEIGTGLTNYMTANDRDNLQHGYDMSINICDEPKPCVRQKIEWDKGTQGPHYIIFSLDKEG